MSKYNNRLTIQLDLGGFSFTIYDSSGAVLKSGKGSYPFEKSDRLTDAILKGSFASVSVYCPTSKYTLVPSEYYSREEAVKVLSSLKSIDIDEKVDTLALPGQMSVMIYAIKDEIISALREHQKEAKFYPLTYHLIDIIPSLSHNNRLICAFTQGQLHIVASERDRLLFANSFPVEDMVTAQYFIFSVARTVLFNPEHTYIYILGEHNKEMKDSLLKYFAEVNYIL
ncbi:MAG: DUF3822 family protein [Bacteroidales bacterium]|nr:DUF3822 family protein [Bacteroidales bacterium]